MLRSLIMKALMLAGTIGLVWWIGWPVSEDPWLDRLQVQSTHSLPGVTANAKLVLPTVNDRGGSHVPKSIQNQNRSAPRLLNLNQATEGDLVQLPGVGPRLAARILEHRNRVGRFHEVADLLEVKGIGPKRYKRLLGLIRVDSVLPLPHRLSEREQPAKQGRRS